MQPTTGATQAPTSQGLTLAEHQAIQPISLPAPSRATWPFPTFDGKPLPPLPRQRKAPPAYPAAPDATF